MNRFNEGKACDAIIRRIEARVRSTRQNLQSPEQQGDVAPVELTCSIGRRLFAFEHTGIEPFERHIALEVKRHFRPLREIFSGKIPNGEQWDLHVPAGATFNLKEAQISKIMSALGAWTSNEAPKIQLPPVVGLKGTPIERPADATVPFKVSLYRYQLPGVPGHLMITHLVDKLENSRDLRIERACQAKYPKLKIWKGRGARTVLILEENDIQLTNVIDVCDSLLRVEKSFQVVPDEVYLVTTSIVPWFVWHLRVDRRSFFDLTNPDDRGWEVDPSTLTSVTNR
jgi:hypothetical protein